MEIAAHPYPLSLGSLEAGITAVALRSHIAPRALKHFEHDEQG